MARWITVTEVKAEIPLNNLHADNIDFNTHINNAQYLDVKPLLGDRLYHDILRDVAATANGSYPDLLDGVDYTDSGYNYTNPGLKKVLIYYTAARYRIAGQEIDTAAGWQIPEVQGMQNPSHHKDQQMYKYYKKTADEYWQEVKKYLNRKSDSYTLWEGSSCNIENGEEDIIIQVGTAS